MRVTWIGLAGAVAVLLAGCDGGSGNHAPATGGLACTTCAAISLTGGTAASGSTNVSTLSTAAAPIPQNEFVDSGMQGTDTSATYTVASTAAALSSHSGFATPVTSLPQTTGTNSTVTLVTDATGNLESITFNITNNAAATFTGSYAPTLNGGVYNGGTAGTYNSWGGSPSTPTAATFDNAFLAPIFKSVNDNGGSANFVISQIAGTLLAPTILASGAYGMWMNNAGGGAGALGVWAMGVSPLLSSIPTTGTATYNGQTIGAATGGTNLMVLTGSIALTANFAAGTVNTTISGIATDNVETGVTGAIPTLSGTQAISSATYQGSIAGGGYSGKLSGGFVGAGALETVGTWNAGNGTVTAIGSYGAK